MDAYAVLACAVKLWTRVPFNGMPPKKVVVMKYGFVCAVWLCLAGVSYAAENSVTENPTAAPVWSWSDKDVDLQCLREAYPAQVQGMADDAQGTWLVLRNGKRVLYAAPQELRPDSLSPQSTVRQSMEQPYPLEPLRPAPAVGEHPGRVRSQDFLAALYGNNKAAVRSQLHVVPLAGRSVLFSSSTGAAHALRKVGTALDALLQRDPKMRAWVLPLGGTFLWRNVAGEERLSPHSFGVAVDLNPSKGAYWRWSGGVSHPAQKLYPSEIVKIFEDNGFVWGGKWREYDLMHFEYRPEILCKAKKRLEAGATPAPQNESTPAQ